MINVLFVSLVFMFGLCIGSFLNVCIYRVPSSTSIINPSRSFCPQCNSTIQFYDNIPVLSYLWLRGRCRNCKAPISFRYPLVELMTGTLAIAILFKFGLTLEGAIYFVFMSSLLVITFIDIDHKIIPDIISLPGIPIGLAASFVLPAMTFTSSLLGLLAGGGSLLLVAWTYSLITRKEGMGGGDIKLLGMIGRLCRLERGYLYHFCRIAYRNFGGNDCYVAKGEKSEIRHSIRPISFHWCHVVCFLWREGSDLVFSFILVKMLSSP